MKTMKELCQSKYLQPWYKNKLKATLWKKCILTPTLYYKLFKDAIVAIINDNGNLLDNPEYRWLYDAFENIEFVKGTDMLISFQAELQNIAEEVNKGESKG